MFSLVGEVVGKDYFVDLKKDGGTLIFNKWESGDYDWNTGLPKEDSTRIRTPIDYKKSLKPNTKYRITIDKNLTWGIRTYRKDGRFIGTYSSPNTPNGVFTTPDNVNYGLMMIVTTDKSIVVKVEEVKE